MRTCKQCGEAKTIEQFRSYYNGGDGHYRVCKVCESINSRRKYLEHKADSDTNEELLMIYQLYDMQRSKGLAPPRQGKRSKSTSTIVSQQLNKLTEAEKELGVWLTCDLKGYTPGELDSIYAELSAKFRHRIGLDTTTCFPIYDETHKTMLDKVLVRFDDYEEDYYAME